MCLAPCRRLKRSSLNLGHSHSRPDAAGENWKHRPGCRLPRRALPSGRSAASQVTKSGFWPGPCPCSKACNPPCPWLTLEPSRQAEVAARPGNWNAFADAPMESEREGVSTSTRVKSANHMDNEEGVEGMKGLLFSCQ